MKKATQKKLKKHSFLLRLAVWVGVFLLVVFIGFGVLCVWVYVDVLPSARTLKTRDIAQTSRIYDRTGERVLYEIHGEENRKIVSHREIADVMRSATVAAEDDGFYRHIGVDPASMARALGVDISDRKMSQGGSTITQQLVRNAFFSREKTIKRKFFEILMAIKIEKVYSKEEILDAYLNEVPYGSNAYGVEAAAETFFGKSAKELAIDEAALLACLPKAPTYYSPYGPHKNELIARQKALLNRMAQLGYISFYEARDALVSSTAEKIRPFSDYISAPHFVAYVKDIIEKEYGRELVENGGLNIYTTLDWDKQQKAEKSITEGTRRNLKWGAGNAALVAVDPRNGDVLAMVGSKDFFAVQDDGQVNVALSPRQPGSSFKPFAYATAFEKGFEPETKILDERTNFGPDGSGKPYIPRNYDGRFHGLLTMREALAQSLNVPAVKTLQLVGIDDTIAMAHRLGITTLNDRKRYGLSLVLGGGEVELLDMASAFSVFANDGIRNPVSPIAKISDTTGYVYFQKEFASQRVLDAQIARRINSILSDNKARTPIFGPRSPLILGDDRPIAAKTGTTQEFRDAWTIGYTPSLSVGVWVGNNDNRPMKSGADGVFVAAPIWKDFMLSALGSAPKENFIAYDKKPEEKSMLLAAGVKERITYYNIKSGKEVSEERVAKMDPEKVKEKIRVQVDYY